MKKKVTIRYNLLLFLYAYLRQIDLSLDRSRWNLWNEFLIYYRKYPAPSEIAKLISIDSEIEYNDRKVFLCIPNSSFFKNKFIGFVNGLHRNPKLSECEILYCYQLLFRFEELLQTEIYEYTAKAEQLRIDIAVFYGDILENKISEKDLNMATQVEHFLEAFPLKTVKLLNLYKLII